MVLIVAQQEGPPSPPPEDAGGPEALRPAQAHPGTGLRHHQVRAGIPPVPAARARSGPRRVEPRDPGLEPEADVYPDPGHVRPGSPHSASVAASDVQGNHSKAQNNGRQAALTVKTTDQGVRPSLPPPTGTLE